MRPIVGVDFDNTLVTYDHLMHAAAIHRGLIDANVRPNKREVRDAVRRLPDGNVEWQKLQALAYGPKLGKATLIEGVQPFFKLCKQNQVDVYVISHKTQYANFDPTKTNLREAALTWMRRNRFFEADGLDMSVEDVYFEPTRQGKLQRIRSLGCTHFIDDLEETFLEDSFPANVGKILFSDGPMNPPLPEIKVASNWLEITDYIFGTLIRDGCFLVESGNGEGNHGQR